MEPYLSVGWVKDTVVVVARASLSTAVSVGSVAPVNVSSVRSQCVGVGLIFYRIYQIRVLV